MGKTNAWVPELLREGLRWEKAGLPDKALELYRAARQEIDDPALLSEAWRLEACAHHGLTAWEDALSAARLSAELARSAGRGDLLAEALNAEALTHYGRGDFERAASLFEAMLELAAGPRIRGLALQNLAAIHGRRGELDRADERLQEAYEAFDAAGYEWGKAHVLNNQVAMSLERGDFGAALGVAPRALRQAHSVEDLELLAIARLNLAEALAGTGELEEAEAQASHALGHFRVSGNLWRRVACLEVLGDLNARQGELEVARRFWETALELARRIGAAVEATRIEARLAGISGSGGSDA